MTYKDMNDHTSTPTSVIFSAPSVTTYPDHQPAYRIYTIDGNYPGSTYSVIDYEVWFFNLTLNNANPNNPVWQQMYPSILKEYGMNSAIPSEWSNLIDRMIKDNTLFEKYRTFHYRRNQYDGLGHCSQTCKNNLLCTLRQFHHSQGKLCPDLQNNSTQKEPLMYSPSRLEFRRKVYEYRMKKRDSENCPL
ncbi:hypothetical protein WR25_09182 [Diploscapter pachys]|uniref:Sphingomyelin phosphodiesterase C-terminal domain-containing protein n=1 Tax=Diploscapter pachys TaxID=2018661 RepID=A0A2A2LY72_9BILA|nr:hypothetical protein WR25_09182 [Diploscapter pachys]